MHVDGIQRVGVSGPGIPAAVYNLVEVLLTDAELVEYRAGYDPSSSSSPSAAVCRQIARLVLDATDSDAAPADMRAASLVG